MGFRFRLPKKSNTLSEYIESTKCAFLKCSVIFETDPECHWSTFDHRYDFIRRDDDGSPISRVPAPNTASPSFYPYFGLEKIFVPRATMTLKYALPPDVRDEYNLRVLVRDVLVPSQLGMASVKEVREEEIMAEIRGL